MQEIPLGRHPGKAGEKETNKKDIKEAIKHTDCRSSQASKRRASLLIFFILSTGEYQTSTIIYGILKTVKLHNTMDSYDNIVSIHTFI